jgi:hypothetical protein
VGQFSKKISLKIEGIILPIFEIMLIFNVGKLAMEPLLAQILNRITNVEFSFSPQLLQNCQLAEVLLV